MKIIIALVIASTGYQPVEYQDTKKALEDAGFTVLTVSDSHGWAKAAGATNNSKTLVDKTLEELKNSLEDISGLFFIGGSEALYDLDTQISYDILQAFKNSGKPYGAICISPRILAKAGVLQEKQATGWDGDHELATLFKKYKVEYVKLPVVTDSLVITADGPNSAQDFGKAIVSVVLGEKK